MENAIIKAVGCSNGVAYNLLDFDLKNNTGLIDDKNIWGHSIWCKFDKILIYEL